MNGRSECMKAWGRAHTDGGKTAQAESGAGTASAITAGRGVSCNVKMVEGPGINQDQCCQNFGKPGFAPSP